jgi:hypothetical protein
VAQAETGRREPDPTRRIRMDVTVVVAVLALVVSRLSFYRSYIYIKQQLDVTVTEVSSVTNQGGLYMTIAFSNGETGPPRSPPWWPRKAAPSIRWPSSTSTVKDAFSTRNRRFTRA